MKIAIMQPYFFPYVGYWKLISEVDQFVILDDVNYIKKGWVNRNRILINGEPYYITAPLIKASQNKKICEIELVSGNLWRDKLLKTIEMNYRKASAFSETFPLIQALIRYDTNNLSDYLSYQIETISRHVGLGTNFVRSSGLEKNNLLAGENKIIDICKYQRANFYLNLPGGKGLYNEKAFAERGISLQFMPNHQKEYKQRADCFVPYMSIVDILLEVGVTGVQTYLKYGDENIMRLG